MKKMKNSLLSKLSLSLVVVAMLLTSSIVNAQSLKINPEKSSMTISGTTNVHNFTSKVSKISGELDFSSNEPKSLTVQVPVRSIVSGEKLMDKKTYETFNDQKNPNIVFKMTEVNSVDVNGDKVTASVTGNLSMGGSTKKITLKVSGSEVKPGVYTFSGSTQLKMSEFNMKAPTAMLGAMKVGDAVTLKYNVTFEGAPIAMK